MWVARCMDVQALRSMLLVLCMVSEGCCCLVQPGDRLIWVAKCTESDSLLLANSEGKAIRFCADDSQVTWRPSRRSSSEIGTMPSGQCLACLAPIAVLLRHYIHDVCYAVRCLTTCPGVSGVHACF